MSRAHFAHKNLPWKEMLNLLCYSTEKPNLLSKKQRLTRLYKSYVRSNHDRIIRGTASENRAHLREMINRSRADFDYMLKLSTENAEFKQLVTKYETYINDNYDPSMMFFDNVAYSPNSQKVVIFSDEVI